MFTNDDTILITAFKSFTHPVTVNGARQDRFQSSTHPVHLYDVHVPVLGLHGLRVQLKDTSTSTLSERIQVSSSVQDVIKMSNDLLKIHFIEFWTESWSVK